MTHSPAPYLNPAHPRDPPDPNFNPILISALKPGLYSHSKCSWVTTAPRTDPEDALFNGAGPFTPSERLHADLT